MKKIKLILILLTTQIIQSQVTEIAQDFYLPTHFNQTGDKVFSIDFDNLGHVWSKNGTQISLTSGKSYDISFDKNIIVGTIEKTEDGETYSVAAYYNITNQEWISLGLDPSIPITNTFYSSAWGVNQEGTTIVGLIFKSSWKAFAYKWTKETGYAILPSLDNAIGSRANGISKTNDIIFGHSSKSDGSWTPCLWKDNQIIKISPQLEYGDATCASYDGKYVAGNFGKDIFIWSESGVERITLTNSDFSSAGINTPPEVYVSCITSDKTIYGFTQEFPITNRKSFVYDKNNGLRTFNTYLKDMGVTTLDDVTFMSSLITTDDKSKISASGMKGQQPYTYVFDMANLSTKEFNNPITAVVFPTITTDNITIALSKKNNINSKVKIVVSNSTGKKVKQQLIDLSSSNLSKEISLLGYASGLYFVTLETNRSKKSFKIIKK